MKENIEEEISVPEGVQVELVGSILTARGPKGESKKEFNVSFVKISKKNNSILVSCKKASKAKKRIARTIEAKIKNILEGVAKGFQVKLKICSGHFPMSVSVDKDKVVIKNFLGEKIPRTAQILPDVNVKVEGDTVTVNSYDKEAATQTAANIEQATRIVYRDRRVFQDGIWVIKEK